MGKFLVSYTHHVEITYDALVEAESAAEAKRKLEDEMDFIEEEEIDYQGISVDIQEVRKVEKDDPYWGWEEENETV